MSKRTLKRQLNLFQVIMLGTAGTIASEIFVLSGHAAGIAGPAAVLAIVIGGLLSYSIALNYSELATIYPETGGALTYVREAWGKGLLSFLVGSMDSISSTFYCALSAVGFSYSLNVFFPQVPIWLSAISIILFFVVLNILGVTKVGNFQMLLGVMLLAIFSVYIIAGFIRPGGFQLTTFLHEGSLFPFKGFSNNFAALMKTIALVYAAYVGFEVIADDAEEIQKPNRNIPIAILVSLSVITLVYSLTMLVTLGVVPWQQLAGSETALTDAISIFLPKGGVVLMAIAGLVATLTSVNTSLLSATRESFTLSRDGMWPRSLSKLNRYRAPYQAILFIGIVSIAISLFGVVDFLSFITSAGYLFVLFWSNLAMIRLRRMNPKQVRPFKAPFFPFTPLLASVTCLIVILFSDIQPLLFTSGVIALFAVYYFARNAFEKWERSRVRVFNPLRSRILVPVINGGSVDPLIHIAAILAQAERDINICILNTFPFTKNLNPKVANRLVQKLQIQRNEAMVRFMEYALERNVPMYTKMVAAPSASEGINGEIHLENNVKLLMLNWPEESGNGTLMQTFRKVLGGARTNLAVLKNRSLSEVKRILVPVGDGIHSRLAIHLASDIASQEGARVCFFRTLPEMADADQTQDQSALVQEIVREETEEIPSFRATYRIVCAEDVLEAILNETKKEKYDLIVIGSSEEWGTPKHLFGGISEGLVEQAGCSIMVVKVHEMAASSWVRRQIRRLEKEPEFH